MSLFVDMAAAQGEYYPWAAAYAADQVLRGRPPLLVRYVPEQVLLERDFGRVLYSVTKFYYRGLLIALTAMPSLRGLLFARTSVPKLEDYYSEVQFFLT